MQVKSLDRQLLEAVRSQDAVQTLELLRRGANPNVAHLCEDEVRRTPLYVAAWRENAVLIRLLMRGGADPYFMDPVYGNTPLGYCILGDWVKSLRILLEFRFDLNRDCIIQCCEPPKILDTPLTLAIQNQRTEIIALLLAKSADVNRSSSSGDYPLAVAFRNGDIKLVTQLIHSHGAKPRLCLREALVGAVEKEHLELTKLALSYGPTQRTINFALVEAVTRRGDAALQVLRLLLDAGADRTVLARGQTLVDRAKSYQNPAVIEVLHHYRPQKGSSTFSSNHLKNPQSQASAPKRTRLEKSVNDVGLREKLAELDRKLEAGRSTRERLVAPSSKDPDLREDVLSQLRTELNSLIGLASVKASVKELIDFLEFQSRRKQHGLKTPDQTLHTVFYGKPGTGKTTVARILGRIYKELGILQKGHLIETDRSGLVAGYEGHTALKVKAVVEQALGGILFIDEAYSLAQRQDDPFGQEAINTLLKLMEDHRQDLIVIVAGYEKPMQQFVRSNPGLQSRFNRYLQFDDYSPSELVSIFSSFAKQNEYSVSDAAIRKLKEVYTRLYSARDERFANGRLARNMFERAINIQATRMMRTPSNSKADMMLLLPSDIPEQGFGQVF